MEKLAIEGGRQLTGSLRIQGAKNAALPILAATVLAEGKHVVFDVPHLSDISVMLQILSALGASTAHECSQVEIDTSSIVSSHIPKELMGQMRSSIFLMGPLLARQGSAIVYPPGGCAIGERKINLHLQGLKALGAKISQHKDYIYCEADQLVGTTIDLDYPSVGATENIMMAATRAVGNTIIVNAAKEPEIIDLQNFLNTMGAKVTGAGTSVIQIVGVDELHAVNYKVIPDRIVAGTMVLAACMTGSNLTLENIVPEHIQSLINVVRQCGVEIEESRDIIVVSPKGSIQPIDLVETRPYPGFPTDMQAQLMTFLALADGPSIIRETVFDGRFKHVDELKKMGAKIDMVKNEAHILGRSRFSAAEVVASDLRAGAALVLAGLAASGTTIIDHIHHIDRGYESIEKTLQLVGAKIKRIGS
jgi:UDP-N-acetylglucosamine 1-carboxyvinyltransferase